LAKSIDRKQKLLEFVKTPAGKRWLRIAKGARYACIAVWLIFPVAFGVVYLIEGSPNLHHILASLAILIVSIGVYRRLTNDLRVVSESTD
jgi:membrane protein YdbS with pleckstrin-like domain